MKNSIWQEDNDYYKLPPLSEGDIKMVEKLFKVKLPDSYLNILMVQNGGHIIYNAFPIEDSYIEAEYIYGIGEMNGILSSPYFIKEWEMPEGLILFNGDGHTWIAFDYRDVSSNPPIVYVDNDSNEITKIADSFNEFLGGLYTEEEEYIDLDIPIKEFKKEDFKTILLNDNPEELVVAINNIFYFDNDLEWITEQFFQLSHHQVDYVRKEIAQYVWGMLTSELSPDKLDQFIKIFKKDSDNDVRLFADLIIEKMNYSFENLNHDLHTYKFIDVMFSFKGHYFRINQFSGKWTLSDNQSDFLESFDTVDELLENATLEGKPLKEMWIHVKKVN